MNNDPGPGAEAFSYEPSEVPHVLAQIARLGEGLKAEFDLLAGRMSWLVIAESFIFSAFATATASYRVDHPLVGVLRYVAMVLPFVGMFLAACVYVAVLAALSAVDTLKHQRDRMMAGLPSRLRIDLISVQTRKQWWGNFPVYVIPPILFLVGRQAVYLRLFTVTNSIIARVRQHPPQRPGYAYLVQNRLSLCCGVGRADRKKTLGI